MKQANEGQKAQAERRHYFRIDDVTILYHKVLSRSEDSFENPAEKLSINKLTLKARFDALNRELQPLHHRLKDDYPTITRYLDALDKKLDMLGDILVETELDSMDVKPQRVNLSAGGVSFTALEAISVDSLVELRIILLPSNIGVYSHAKVVSCNEIKSGPPSIEKSYKVAVQFVSMNDEMRDIISRHVLSRERELISKENDDE